MRTSCITHGEGERFVIIRDSYVKICDGNHCAAALLSFFEYWHNIRLEQSVKAEQANKIAEMHGDPPTQDTTLWQFHTVEQLERGLIGLYKKKTIAEAIDLLVVKRFIHVGRNPNPKYAFDKTRWIMLRPSVINAAMEQNRPVDGAKKDHSGAKSIHGGAKTLLSEGVENHSQHADTETDVNGAETQNLPLRIQEEEYIQRVYPCCTGDPQSKIDQSEPPKNGAKQKTKASLNDIIELLPQDRRSKPLIDALTAFYEHRQQLRKPLTLIGAKMLVKHLCSFPISIAVVALETSVENGWQGVFPERFVSSQHNKTESTYALRQKLEILRKRRNQLSAEAEYADESEAPKIIQEMRTIDAQISDIENKIMQTTH